MKKVIGILALLVFAGNIASAELLKNFKHDGKIEVNAVSANNNADADSDAKDKTSDVNVRVQLNATFDLADDVEGVVSVVKSNEQYGDTGRGEDANTILSNLKFEQAYLNLKGVLGFDHKVGRQYYGNEKDLVIYYGPRSWPYADGITNPLSVTGIDAYSGWYKTDKLSIHGIAAKTANTNTAVGGVRNPDTDTDIVGVVGKYNLMELLNIGAYIYEQKGYVAASADTTLDVIGVKVDGKLEALNLSYYGELAKNYGRQGVGKNYTGTAFLAGAAMDIELAGKWTFNGEFGIGSGDDETYGANDEVAEFTSINTDYRPGVIWGGVLGNTGLDDTTLLTLGAKWNTPMSDKLTLSGNVYYLAPTVTKVNSTAAGAAKADIGYDTYGQELDICAKWQHSENVSLKAYYAMFMTNGDYADAVNAGKDDLATAIGAALTVKF